MNKEILKMIKSIIKKSLYFTILLFCTFSFTAQAAIPKISTPYPEVWGYDLSEFPAVKEGLSDVASYAMSDGDIWFVATYSNIKSNSKDPLVSVKNNKYMLIKFFKGEQILLNAEEWWKLFDTTGGKKLFPGYPINKDILFSDGSSIKVHRYSPAKRRCYVPDFIINYIIKTDAQGKEKKYSILGASTQVSIWQSDRDCIVSGTSHFLYQKLHVLTEVIPLKDDTFITHSISDPNLILRFDKDFNTKFKPVTPVNIHGNEIMRNFFVIDYELIKKFVTQSLNKTGATYQNIHDELLNYFQEQYSNI